MFALLLAACAERSPAPARSLSGSAFELAPDFAAFYQAHGGPRTFGYPISLPYRDEAGHTAQYLENMKLSLDPASGAVVVEPLGVWGLALSGIEASQDAAPSTEFLSFYERMGGQAVFGPALTERIAVAGHWVQYFENARFEWDPEEPPDLRLQVTPLGLSHYNQTGVANRYPASVRADNLALVGDVGPVNVSASMTAPILFTGDTQGLAVRVTHQNEAPGAGLTVVALLTYADGQSERVNLGLTDRRGLVRAEFTPGMASPGQRVAVQVLVLGPDGTLLGETQTMFKAWW